MERRAVVASIVAEIKKTWHSAGNGDYPHPDERLTGAKRIGECVTQEEL